MEVAGGTVANSIAMECPWPTLMATKLTQPRELEVGEVA